MATFPDSENRNPLASDCQRCPRLVESRNCISWGVGSLDATLVVVGEAPGAGDPDADCWRGGNHTGMAYTARHSGRRIRERFEALGYDEEELYFTNAVKCFPAENPEAPDSSNREPTAAERANCRPYLRSELADVQPACVVPTGRHATESLLAAVNRSLDGFLETVLTTIETDVLPPLVPILHPSYEDIWIPRLGYEPEEYESAISAALERVGAGPR
jgi:DNA polymerase